MNISVADAGTCLKKITIEFPVEEVDKKYRDGLRTLASQVNLPGFRAGKAPAPVLEKKYGKWLTDNVRQELLEEAIEAARRDHNLDIISPPTADSLPEVRRGEPFKAELTVEVRPEFELPEYRGLEIVATEQDVTEEEIEIFIKNLRMTHGKVEELKAGDKLLGTDVIYGDFMIVVDGKRVANRSGGSVEACSNTILGIPVAEAPGRFVGMEIPAEPRDEKFVVTVPTDFPMAELAGKPAEVVVTVRAGLRPEMPELTQELITGFGFDSLEALRDHARKILKREKDRQVQGDIQARLLDRVVSAVQLDIPRQYAERHLSSILQREAYELFQQGIPEAEVQGYIDRRKGELPAQIEQLLKENFVIEAIAKKERVFVTEDDIAREVENIATQRGQDPQQVYAAVQQNNMLPQIRAQIRSARVKQDLARRAKISWTKAGEPVAQPTA